MKLEPKVSYLIALFLVSGLLVLLNIVLSQPQERITLGRYDEDIERAHIARYEFAKPYCEGKTVADIASGTCYGVKILQSVATTVDGYDKEDFGCNYVIDLEKQAWEKKYDVIVSFETIEHLANPEFFIRNVSTSASTLILSTPLHDEPRLHPFHKQFWTVESISSLLGKYFVCEYFFQNGTTIAQTKQDGTNIVAVCRVK